MRPKMTNVAALFAGFSAQTEALSARFTTPPTAARKALINNLFAAASSHGWLQHLDVLNLIGADEQASTRNWIEDAFNTVNVNSVAFTADDHFATDGTTNYLDMVYNAATDGGNFTQNDALVGVWVINNTGVANSLIGWFDGTDGVSINPRSNTNLASFRINQVAAPTTASASSIGLWTVERTAAAVWQAFHDGASFATGTDASTAANSASMNVGRLTGASFRANQVAVWMQGSSMGATKQADMHADILAYLQGIGAV